MEAHHLAWLQGHPDRTAEWLKARLADGFDVHHADGDHSNNDPGNLVLVEHLDHMRLHAMPGNRLLAPKAKPTGSPKSWRETDQYKTDRARTASKRARRAARIDAIDLLP